MSCILAIKKLHYSFSTTRNNIIRLCRSINISFFSDCSALSTISFDRRHIISKKSFYFRLKVNKTLHVKILKNFYIFPPANVMFKLHSHCVSCVIDSSSTRILINNFVAIYKKLYTNKRNVSCFKYSDILWSIGIQTQTLQNTRRLCSTFLYL